KLMEGNYYYASFEPDHNIISLLAPHFAKRLSDQKWVLHDLKRKTAAIFDTEGWFLSPIDALQELRLSDKENDFQNLWKLYFKNISIKSRTNLKLQRKYMPKRYWAHIVEMDQQFFT
ncbi:MAG: TIGR03915 family putative DNA repair protein, partial [Bacillota bacterium]|nr:TIGR03915 family putative DNA repair protein [Bacillota bacterium]